MHLYSTNCCGLNSCIKLLPTITYNTLTHTQIPQWAFQNFTSNQSGMFQLVLVIPTSVQFSRTWDLRCRGQVFTCEEIISMHACCLHYTAKQWTRYLIQSNKNLQSYQGIILANFHRIIHLHSKMPYRVFNVQTIKQFFILSLFTWETNTCKLSPSA
jgi:hypothetical protein